MAVVRTIRPDLVGKLATANLTEQPSTGSPVVAIVLVAAGIGGYMLYKKFKRKG
jgi:hypothetical protein